MKKYFALCLVSGLLIFVGFSCEKEQPAKNIEGNYSGVLKGTYDGEDTITGGYPVYATSSTKNKVTIQGNLFGEFEVLVSQNGVNVVPVSTDDVIYEFLYQGDLNELSFRYYKNGDSTYYVGTKP